MGLSPPLYSARQASSAVLVLRPLQRHYTGIVLLLGEFEENNDRVVSTHGVNGIPCEWLGSKTIEQAVLYRKEVSAVWPREIIAERCATLRFEIRKVLFLPTIETSRCGVDQWHASLAEARFSPCLHAMCMRGRWQGIHLLTAGSSIHHFLGITTPYFL